MLKLFICLFLITTVLIGGCGTKNTEQNHTSGDSIDNVSIGNEGTDAGLPTIEDLEKNKEDSLKLLAKMEYEVHTKVKDNIVTFEMSLQNNASEQMQLGFSSGQQFEIVVKDAQNNKELFRYSDGMMFTEAFVYKDMKENETLTWSYDWNVNNINAKELIATVTLLPMSINNAPIEANPFVKDVSFSLELPCETCEKDIHQS